MSKKPTYSELQAIATSGNSVFSREEARRMGLDLDELAAVKAVVIRKSADAVVVKPLDGKGQVVTFYRDHDGDENFYELHSHAIGDEIELRRGHYSG
jgi:glutathione synthase/RimK-type ligase-like ATP-grasp enzyme